MTDPQMTAGLVAHSDQVAAELSSWACLLANYRAKLVDGGFSENRHFAYVRSGSPSNSVTG